MFSQLVAMEKAGLPADKAWGLLKLPNVSAARLKSVHEAVARGGNPAVAAQNAQLFTKLEGNLVRAALAAGSPENAYRRLADTCSQRAEIEGKISARMVLPGAMLVLALLIQPLPRLLEGTLNGSGYLMQLLKPILAVGALFVLAKWLLASANLRRVMLKMPLYGAAAAKRDALNFFESLGLLLEAGVPMFEALPTAVATIESSTIRAAYARIKPCMQRGVPLSNALTAEISDALYLGNPRVIDFIATGEASGTLSDMLLRHVTAETEALGEFWRQVADWLPRIVYTAVVFWMAYGLLTGHGFGPRVPSGI